VKEALTDKFWINVMQEELGQYKRNVVWKLVPIPERLNVIDANWIYKNKSNESCIVTMDKVRLVAQGSNEGGIDKTLHVNNVDGGKIMVTLISVDDDVYGGMSNSMLEHFVRQVQSEFEMNLVGELTYFPGLQVEQMEDTILISESKYHVNIM